MGHWSCVKIPFACHWGGGAANKDVLFWTGGDDGRGNPSNGLWIYSPRHRTWERGPDMPLPVSWHGCALVGEELFCVGGKATSGPTNVVQVYHIPTRRWRLAPPLPFPVWQHAVAAMGLQLFCLGGLRDSKTLDEVWALPHPHSRWCFDAPLSTPRRGHLCLPLEDSLFCLGGSRLEAPGGVELVEQRTSASGMWQRWGTLPSPGWTGTGTLWQQHLLYVGFRSRSTWCLPCYGGDCIPGPTLPSAMPGSRVFAIGKHLILTDKACLWQSYTGSNILS